MPGHPGIDQEAAFAGRADRPRGTPRRWHRSRPAGRPPRSSSRIASRTARSSSTTKMVGGRGPSPSASAGCGVLAAAAAAARRAGAGSCRVSSFAFDRLAEMHAAGVGDLAQGIGRDVAGQDDRRDFAMRATRAGRDDCAGQIARQIVIGDDEIRQQRPPRRQFQRLSPSVDGACGVPRPRTAAPASRAPRDRPRRSGSRRLCLGDRLPRADRAGPRSRGSFSPSGTSIAKTEPLPGRERTSIAWPSRSPGAARSQDRGQGRGCARGPDCRADGTPRRSPAAAPRECRCRCPRPRCAACRRAAGSRAGPCPRSVYFTAFDSRLRSICSSRRGSLRTLRRLGTTRQPSCCAVAW